ncbi:hypothetical protein F2Q68_00008816 [Brassica cretica]|uniref:non-specific serine/threonine protein kinase n=1 Tax=Brassica cretica TaxID=69181 RepID=A0A8S9KLB5_BRACR|nr:hypothetical protein F2Q68_00008816 [Brassica cretica]
MPASGSIHAIPGSQQGFLLMLSFQAIYNLTIQPVTFATMSFQRFIEQSSSDLISIRILNNGCFDQGKPLINMNSHSDLHFCRPHQRDALLEFKDEFPTADSSLSSWNKSSDCCLWKGVTCADKSGQVISLDIPDTSLNSSLKTSSSLFKLQYLLHLNLMDCNLQGEIPSSLGKLSRLTLLDLDYNDLVGEIPSSLGNLSSLAFLDLSYNKLVGEIPDSIGNLIQLTYLSLGFNGLTGEIPFSLGNLSRLSNLKLESNHFTGEVPSSIGNLSEVRLMWLGGNILSGNFPISFANLKKLSDLSLYSNNFSSTLPSNMTGLHSLKYFDVTTNSFSGPFPKSLFSIPSLETVFLAENQFTGPVEFADTSSSSKLQSIYLGGNRFEGPIPESISKFLNLEELHLQHNNFSGPIPSSISKIANLHYLDISNNMLEGEVPGWLWRLATVMLSHNYFSSFENSSQDTVIQQLDLNSNSFRGPFPHWICNLRWLRLLDLSNNLFDGSIPPCLKNLTGSMTELILENNNFSGNLPDVFTNATNLRSLEISRNQLEGKLPKSLINCKALKLVNVESNGISDEFPSWLGSLPSLHVLILRSNHFYGPLYRRHLSVGFQSLRVIDISHNDFNGTIPPNYFSNWREMTTVTEEMNEDMVDSNYSTTYFHSMEMVLKGVDTSFERIEKDFRAIDFSGNKISGKIPESIGLLKELRLLNFSDLGNLTFLSYMNFSHNLLQGPVPRGTQFQRQKCSSFLDNPKLFGLEEICGEPHILYPPSQQTEEQSESDEPMFSWIAASVAYVPGVFCGLVIGYIFISHNHGWFTEKFG